MSQLQAICSRLGLDSQGPEAQLVERLQQGYTTRNGDQALLTYSDLSSSELQGICQQFKLDSVGTDTQLIDRIADFTTCGRFNRVPVQSNKRKADIDLQPGICKHKAVTVPGEDKPHVEDITSMASEKDSVAVSKVQSADSIGVKPSKSLPVSAVGL